jgi:methylaspartate mutase sigma subunit
MSHEPPIDHDQGRPDRPHVLLTTLPSDAHTWNLVFLERLISESGHHVTNLGPCVPDDLLVEECLRVDPDLVVVSTVNGHGLVDGIRAITALRAESQLTRTPVVIGGKLGISGAAHQTVATDLRRAGYTAVFGDGTDLPAFQALLASLPSASRTSRAA